MLTFDGTAGIRVDDAWDVSIIWDWGGIWSTPLSTPLDSTTATGWTMHIGVRSGCGAPLYSQL